MVRAIGFSIGEFEPHEPGRLCRARERWIDPWETDVPPPAVHRVVLTGAAFSDDSARDAIRGLEHGGLDVAGVLSSLFPRKELLAFMEDGHPADIPDETEDVELYETWRNGGRTAVTAVRWTKRVSGVKEVRALLGADPNADRVRGFVVLDGEEIPDGLAERLFLLVGLSTLDSPPARFQPLALSDLVELVPAIVLVHRDKNGSALGIYSKAPLPAEDKIPGLVEKKGSLLVRFAIPPMLARWDRALAEARAAWTGEEPFPVPQSTEPYGWERRRRRRRRDDDADDALEDGADVAIGDGPGVVDSESDADLDAGADAAPASELDDDLDDLLSVEDPN
jgi:hypothetical protein